MLLDGGVARAEKQVLLDGGDSDSTYTTSSSPSRWPWRLWQTLPFSRHHVLVAIAVQVHQLPCPRSVDSLLPGHHICAASTRVEPLHTCPHQEIE